MANGYQKSKELSKEAKKYLEKNGFNGLHWKAGIRQKIAFNYKNNGLNIKSTGYDCILSEDIQKTLDSDTYTPTLYELKSCKTADVIGHTLTHNEKYNAKLLQPIGKFKFIYYCQEKNKHVIFENYDHYNSNVKSKVSAELVFMKPDIFN